MCIRDRSSPAPPWPPPASWSCSTLCACAPSPPTATDRPSRPSPVRARRRRRGRDSNPRDAIKTPAGFQDRCIQPLCHPSGGPLSVSAQPVPRQPTRPRRARRPGRDVALWARPWQDGPVRRLITVACAVIFVDVAFFEAITPLLADYRNQLGLGEGEAGLLVGSYAVGS